MNSSAILLIPVIVLFFLLEFVIAVNNCDILKYIKNLIVPLTKNLHEKKSRKGILHFG